MMRLARKLVLVLMALWLPVSVSAAGALSLAMSGQPGVASEQMAEGCEQHQQETGSETPAGDCHNCSLCHFACTALISESHFTGAVQLAWTRPEFVAPGTPLHVPDRLQRPPLAP